MIRDDYAAPETLEEARAPLYGIGYGFRVAVLVWAAVALVWVVLR